MTESVNISIGRSVNITKSHTIKTGMNINQNLLLRQRVPQSLELHCSIHKDKNIYVNKPDTTIKDHKNNSCLLAELMFPMNKKLVMTNFKKISK